MIMPISRHRSHHGLRAARFIAIPLLAACTALSGCIPALFIGGASGVAYVANDRRTSDTVVADQRIELAASARLAKLGDDIRISSVSFNRQVLLTGQARTAEIRTQAVQSIAGIEGVRQVFNEIVVFDPLRETGLPADALMSTQVKARMVGNGIFNPLHVRVNSDRGVVYLMGLVTRGEADSATRIASTTRDVTRVVRLFEIIPVAPESAPAQKAGE
jgi:osmotically-inducible protein OsmY